MERKAAKELLHIQGWLNRVEEVVERGKDTYLIDDLLQEAGDSLMMKLGRPRTDCPDSTSWRRRALTGHLQWRTGTS